MENETSFQVQNLTSLPLTHPFQDMISIILTITFLLFSYNEVMPRVSYIKAMDVYLGREERLFPPIRFILQVFVSVLSSYHLSNWQP